MKIGNNAKSQILVPNNEKNGRSVKKKFLGRD